MAVSAAIAARVARRELLADAGQVAAAQTLDAALARATAAAKWDWMPGWLVPEARGAYLSGGVGSGKSMLMDTLHDEAARAGVRTKRIHWHEWIDGVHRRLHDLRKSSSATAGQRLQHIGRETSAEVRLLCFDELAVHDPADALVFREIFSSLFADGVVVVATSNRAPRELYHAGINREQLFVPFIDLLEARVDHVTLGGGPGATDWRRAAAAAAVTGGDNVAPLYVVGRAGCAEAAAALAGRPLEFSAASAPLPHGRALAIDVADVPSKDGPVRIARAPFSALCDAPLSAADYHALCDAYAALVLTGVPVVDPARHDLVRRLTALVDVLYDRGRAVVVEADAPADALLGGDAAPAPGDAARRVPGGTLAFSREGGTSGRHVTHLGDGTEWSATGIKGAALGAYAGAEDTRFAWARTTSRLAEMTRAPGYRQTWRRSVRLAE